jgi:hypothetical protein
MRLLFFIVILSFIFGCASTKKLAPMLDIPAKPLLTKEVYQLSYSTELDSARIKSVQLPAHPIKTHNTVRIVTDKVSMTDTLKAQLIKALNSKGLEIVESSIADYILTVHQLDLEFGPNKTYTLNQPRSPHPFFTRLAQQVPSYQCANIIASVSMRLTHQASSDVVWFAQSSIDSASFQGIPLQVNYTQKQSITNEHAVISFIVKHNTDAAREARFNNPITTPSYNVKTSISQPTKIAGACSKTEVSALSSAMQTSLTNLLIDKINLQ